MKRPTAPIIFKFLGKTIAHRLPPGRYTATISKSRINRAGNLELTLSEVKPAESKEV